ncbi:MAG: sn-glycerol-3-phosphate ABC transporter ATP-binding protein UgpC [Kiritimatiellae bacterium]|nr:sn-glycerol-3-phosphate ABC transporter ATP-binding protein UgpC [Kiritimatiellia bacterium]
MANVTLTNVSKIFPGNVEAVRDFSLEVQDREFVVLVGPSGCGKSTTLRLIAGLEEITSGTISIDGRIVNNVPPKDRDIAMVFQNYALYPHMTVFDNMAFGLKLRGVERSVIRERVIEAATILGIQHLLDRRPKALSGGERQRVAVGRAIVRKPKVFLFDEPLSNLDAKMRVQMRVELGRLHRRLAATMIYVTHDQAEAMTLGDRIVVMKDGRIQQVADPITLYDHPANRFVAGFIGTPPMNFVEGTLEAEAASQPIFLAENLRLPLPVSWMPRLRDHLNEKVTLGIRPEDIGPHIVEQFPGAPRVRAGVDVVEPLGAESYVHFRVVTNILTAKVDSHRHLCAGETVDVAINVYKVHIFECDTSRTII